MNESSHKTVIREQGSSQPAGPLSLALPEDTRSSRSSGLVAWLGRLLTIVLILGGMAGLVSWGNRAHWHIPRFSSLTGAGEAPQEDWCAEHGVPESQCIECQPDLLPRGKEFGWCKQHGIPECPYEHPELAQVKRQPQVTPDDLARSERALDFAPRPENNSKCKLHLRRLQFASREAVERAGIEVAPVWEAPVVESLRANGQITYDQNRVARLSARVSGTMWRVLKRVGDRVRQGELLALVDAVEVGKVKAEFLQALVQVDLKDKNLESLRANADVLPVRTLREGEAALREAQIRLLTAEQALVNLGLPLRADDVKGLRMDELARRIQFVGLPGPVTAGFDPRTTTANLLPIRSPLEGIVIAREVVPGEVVDTTKVLFAVADTRRMWVTLHVRLEDAGDIGQPKRLDLGKPVRFRLDGSTEEVVGTITWISTAVDEQTRTLKVRAELDNSAGRLRANLFGQGQIVLRQEDSAIVVPSEAVQWEGCCHIVFVRDKNYFQNGAPKFFHVRKVRIGASYEEFGTKYTEIIAGVLVGEEVATTGSNVLRTELLKNNLGEGCADCKK